MKQMIAPPDAQPVGVEQRVTHIKEVNRFEGLKCSIVRPSILASIFLLTWLGFIHPLLAETNGEAKAPIDAVANFDAAWEILNATHWDTNFNGLDWQKVYDSLLPQAEAARSLGELRSVIELMLQKLGPAQNGIIPAETTDTEAGITTLVEPLGDIGLELRCIGDQPVVSRVLPNTPAANAGIQPGWILQQIDGEDVKTFGSLTVTRDQRLRKMIAWARTTERLQGKAGSSVNLAFQDAENRVVHQVCTRMECTGNPIKFGFLPALFEQVEQDHHETEPGVRVGFIRFNLWMPSLMDRLDQAIDEMRHDDGLILDLRGNPGGLATLASGVAGHFTEKIVPLGEMQVRQARVTLATDPRTFTPSGDRVSTFKAPLAILVDEHSLSVSEIFAAGMQRLGRARIFGQTTPGYASPAMEDALPNGDRLVHAAADFRDPNGKRWDQNGVIPDVAIPLKRTELFKGKDAAREAAELWITSQVRSVTSPAEPDKLGRQAKEGSISEAVSPPNISAEAGLPSAAEIITRFVQAIGGTNALARHQSAVIRCKVELNTMHLEGQSEAFHARPNKSRSRMTLGSLKTEHGFDGAVGWSTDPISGPKLLKGKALNQITDEADFEAMIHPARLYRSIRVMGKVQFEGQECYHLVLVSQTAREWSEFFAVKTGLLAGSVISAESESGGTPATTVLSDYKDFGGLLVPSRMTTKLHHMEVINLVESIEYDTVPEDVFALPSAIQNLMSPRLETKPR